MIDSVIFKEAQTKAGGKMFVLRDPDDGLWLAFEGDTAILARATRRAAIEDGKKYLERMKNPIRCCGRELSPFEEARCLRCGEDYR